jgi:hypothetical protein
MTETETPKRRRGRHRKTESEERRTVRVDTDTFAVYPETGPRTYDTRIGAIVELVTNDGARTPSGGKFTSRRLTVRFRDDSRRWVGQFKNDEKVLVILRPLPNEEN